jgi:hypothetical protein
VSYSAKAGSIVRQPNAEVVEPFCHLERMNGIFPVDFFVWSGRFLTNWF